MDGQMVCSVVSQLLASPWLYSSGSYVHGICRQVYGHGVFAIFYSGFLLTQINPCLFVSLASPSNSLLSGLFWIDPRSHFCSHVPHRCGNFKSCFALNTVYKSAYQSFILLPRSISNLFRQVTYFMPHLMSSTGLLNATHPKINSQFPLILFFCHCFNILEDKAQSPVIILSFLTFPSPFF